jgi:hypothetical protein
MPQEILDDILSRVDCPEQSSLALVSKAFRPQVQRLRFHKITLEEEHPDRTERVSNVLALNPSLGGYVHTVCLARTWNSGINQKSKKAQALDLLERVLRACSIQTLIVSSGFVTQHDIRLLSPQNLPHLRSLWLNPSCLVPMDALHNVLSLHPPLEHLWFCTFHLPTPCSPGRERIRVKRLRVIVDRPSSKNDWTFDHLCNVEEELRIRVLTTLNSEHTAINKALQFWGVTSRRLRIDIFSGVLREFRRHPCSKAR